ncbi:MAG: hypothetical protein ACIALR_00110, partial [Blastopirellula sp. JB062]
MQIEAQASTTATAAAQPLTADDKLQSLFSEILQQAGRSGYQSAEAYAPDQSLEEDVRTSWEEWFSPQVAASYAADYD